MGQIGRREVTLTIGGREVSLPVTMRVVEMLERVYSPAGLEVIVSVELAVWSRVQRSKVAEAIADWLQVEQKKIDVGGEPMRRREILDYVMGSHPTELNLFVGALQAAAFSCIRGLDGQPVATDVDFAKLVKGESVDLLPRYSGKDQEKKASPADEPAA